MPMKTQEELNILKEEIKAINEKLRELTDDEMEQVTGGENVPHVGPVFEPPDEPVFEPPVPIHFEWGESAPLK